MTGTEKRIYTLATLCAIVAALAFIVPRLLPSREGGFAIDGTAILVFLGMLFGATVLSLYLLIVTIQAYREISMLPRLAGIGPSIVLVLAVALLLGFLRY